MGEIRTNFCTLYRFRELDSMKKNGLASIAENREQQTVDTEGQLGVRYVHGLSVDRLIKH